MPRHWRHDSNENRSESSAKSAAEAVAFRRLRWHSRPAKTQFAGGRSIEQEPDTGAKQADKQLDSEEFVSLVLTSEARVRGFITTLMLPSSEVDDVYQSTCMAAFRKLSDFRFEGDQPEASFIRWLCTIAKYEVLLYYRRRRTSKVTFSSEVVERLADLQLEQTTRTEDRLEALGQCIEALDERDKTLLFMRYGKNVPVIDIGKEIGRTANGVYKALERVRARLLACIQIKLRPRGVN